MFGSLVSTLFMIGFENGEKESTELDFDHSHSRIGQLAKRRIGRVASLVVENR